MMVNVGNDKYKFRFVYEELYDGDSGLWGKDTHCIIEQVVRNGVALTPPERIALGTACLSPKDQFVKSIGRHIAFKRAVEQIKPPGKPPRRTVNTPHQAIREALWDSYVTTHNLPPKESIRQRDVRSTDEYIDPVQLASSMVFLGDSDFVSYTHTNESR